MGMSKITRRQLLKGIGTTILGYMIFAPNRTSAASSAAVNPDNYLAGSIERLETPQTAHLKTPKGAVKVRFTNDAAFWRYGSHGGAKFTDYAQREEVVAEGEWLNDVFQAKALHTKFRSVEGRITARQVNRLETTVGVLHLTPTTRDQGSNKSVARLALGDEVRAMIGVEPNSGNRLVAAIQVKE
jgi:hypothetical protein